MAEWGTQQILSTETNDKSRQNDQNQKFQDSGNWIKKYNKFRSSDSRKKTTKTS